ncbi:MAG: serine/threonine-protein kinase [Planctomycetales bacterium]
MVSKIIGPFELGEKLGAGGMAVVYRATYTETGKQVALKLLPITMAEDDQMVARFKRELEVLKKMRHPNIVLCYGGGRLGQQRFYAMELVEGGSLANLLKAKGRLSWEEVVDYGIQICDALQHAHEHGIVHRDLKPANLMLDKAGKVKLADFGLARVTDATALTAAGKTLGTFAYMAPEQITGKSPITPKTDLYALGCVFYELLTGRTPFNADSAAELFYQHIQKKPERLCSQVLDCPVWLEAIILHLLKKSPDDRPMDALQVSESLKEVRSKVAANVGVVQHSVTGDPSTLSVMADTTQMSDLLKKKKKKKSEKNLPFYEKTWFLGVALAVVLLGVVYVFLPPSEDTLFGRASVLMANADPAYWTEAQEKYLIPLQKRFPNGKYTEKIQEFTDRIDMDRADKQVRATMRFGGIMKSEAGKHYLKASRFEQLGDRVTAMKQYSSVIELFKNNPEERPYVLLAQKHIAEIGDKGGSGDDSLNIVRKALDNADTAYQDGRTVEANRIWESVRTLYGDNQEFAPLVARANRRLVGNFKDPTSTPEKTDAEKGTPENTIPDKTNGGAESAPGSQNAPPRNVPTSDGNTAPPRTPATSTPN